MNPRRSRPKAGCWLALSLLLVVSAPVLAQDRPQRKPFAKAETPRRTPRIRAFDVIHTKGEITLDPARSEVKGTVTHTIRPLAAGFRSLTLDCGTALTVTKVVAGPGGKSCGVEHRREALLIQLDRAYSPEETLDVAVTYAGSPERGLFFIKPDAGHPNRPLAIWTQGEAEETRDWLPCNDYPNDRATSEMIVTVAKPLIVVSNGALLETRENGDDTRTFHWKMDVPHVSYLISLAASDFGVYRDKAGELPLEYYAAKTFDEASVRRALGKTPKMVAFFGDKTGAAYPYPKYAQVFVPEFTMGGMENISATTLNEFVLTDAVGAKEMDADGLVAHELAHQWFGDLLTCRDWSNLWLNEGFASYFGPLFTEFDRGEDAFRIEMAGALRGYLAGDRQYRRPIVEERYDNALAMFDGVTYSKGSLVLHALRGLVGDEAWWAGIRRYVKDNRERLVSTDDFRKAMEAASGKDLKGFFDQWTAKGGHPELKVRWRYEPEDKTARVTVEQTQPVDAMTPMFRLPTTLELTDDSGTKAVAVVVDGPRHEFVIPCPSAPKMVRIDPRGWIPKDLTTENTPEAWTYQLAHAADALGRLEAARELGKRKDDAEAAKALAAAWPKEKLAEARAAVVEALGSLGEVGRAGLLEAAKDADARVKFRAFRALTRLNREPAAEALLRAALADRQEAYGVRKLALAGLVDWKVDDRDRLIAEAIATPSNRDVMAAAGVEQKLRDDGPTARDDAALYSAFGRPDAVRSVGLRALGRLAKDDPALQDVLIGLIEDPERSVRVQSAQTLAGLGVKRAAEKIEAQAKLEEMSTRNTMEEAAAGLKAAAKPPSGEPAEVAELDRKAAELELQAKELRNRAESLRLQAERSKRANSAGP